MNELKIREDGIYLNNQKLKGVQAIKTKSTAENNHATVYLKFISKLIWNEVGNNLWWNIFKDIKRKRKENGMSELGLIIVTIVNVVCAVINLFCFIKDRMEWFMFENETNSLTSLDLDFTR